MNNRKSFIKNPLWQCVQRITVKNETQIEFKHFDKKKSFLKSLIAK